MSLALRFQMDLLIHEKCNYYLIFFKLLLLITFLISSLLKNSLYDEKPDVCFFISDSIPKKGDQDETVRKFKETLEAAGIDNISYVMTLGQLKRDYSTHNLKQKLCNTYDVFLVESKIAEHVFSVLGKPFIKKRKRPFQIDTKNDKTMKISIENAFKKTVMKITPKSMISSFEVGISKMDDDKIVENILVAIEQLEKLWPGGNNNVSRIYMRPMQPSKVSIPIYASTINPNDVVVPVIVGAKQKRLTKLEQKLKSKSEKLKLDLTSKKIVKAKKKGLPAKAAETDGVESKKRKIDESNQKAAPKKSKKEEAIAEIVKDKKNKKKKSEETQQAVTVADKFDKKKKKKADEQAVEVAVEVVDEVKEKGKKKKKSAAAAVIEAEPAVIKTEKKSKKKASAVDNDDVVTEQPAKPKNKKKSTAVTDAINSRDEKSTDGPAENEQTAANSNKKKKAKKNKA